VIAALAALGGRVCSMLEAIGYAPLRCDDTEGMALMGGVTILLVLTLIATGATTWSLMRR
jgi:hypothetical protein